MAHGLAGRKKGDFIKSMLRAQVMSCPGIARANIKVARLRSKYARITCLSQTVAMQVSPMVLLITSDACARQVAAMHLRR
jgi:hypothetical protein